jgi:hypothetical protein
MRASNRGSIARAQLSVRLLVESMESIPAFAIVANEAGEIVFANRQVLGYW